MIRRTPTRHELAPRQQVVIVLLCVMTVIAAWFWNPGDPQPTGELVPMTVAPATPAHLEEPDHG